MGSFQHSKRSDNKRCIVGVRLGIFIENLTVFFFIPKRGRRYSHINFYNFMTLLCEMIISQLELRPLRFNLNKWNGIANSEGKKTLNFALYIQ